MKLKLITTVATAFTVSLAGAAAEKGKGGKGSNHAGPSPHAAAVFAAIDSDGSGSINPQELGASKRFADSTKKEVGAAFKEKDLNGDGFISEHEFVKTFRSESGPGSHHGKSRGKGKGKGKGAGK